jgi:hypothetical protein
LKNLERGRAGSQELVQAAGWRHVEGRESKATDGEGVKALSRLAEKNPRKVKLKRGTGGRVG